MSSTAAPAANPIPAIPLTLWSQVNRELAPAEVDANFTGLGNAIAQILALGVEATGIAGVTYDQVKGTIAFSLTDGTIYGPWNLPGQPFRTRGAWVTATKYQPADLVSINGGSYLCVTAHTSGTFDDDLTAGLWQPLAQGGVNGTNGKDFATFQGQYDNNHQYQVGDMVVWSDPRSPTFQFNLWRLTLQTPKGGLPPGSLVTADDTANAAYMVNGVGFPYWNQLSYSGSAEHYGFLGGTQQYGGQQMMREMILRVSIADPGFPGCIAKLRVAPKNALNLIVYKNGAVCGAIAFAAGSTTGTFATVNNASVTFVPGDLLQVGGPNTPDTAAADFDLGFLFRVVSL